MDIWNLKFFYLLFCECQFEMQKEKYQKPIFFKRNDNLVLPSRFKFTSGFFERMVSTVHSQP